MENTKPSGDTGNPIQVIDLWTHEHLFSLPVTEKTSAIALSPTGDRAFLTHYETDQLTIWDTSARALLASVPVGRNPKGVTLSPDGSRLYVTNSGSRDISVINTETLVIEHTLPLEGKPIGISSAENGLLFILTEPIQNENILEQMSDPAMLATPLNREGLDPLNGMEDPNQISETLGPNDPTNPSAQLPQVADAETLLNKLPTVNNMPNLPDTMNMPLPTNLPPLELPKFPIGDLPKLDLPNFPNGMIPSDLFSGSWNLGAPNGLNMIPPLPPFNFDPSNLAFSMPPTLPSNFMLPTNLPFQDMNLNLPTTAGVNSLNPFGLASTLNSGLRRKAQLNKLTHLRQKIRSLGLPDHVCKTLEKNLNKAIFHLKTFIQQVKRFMVLRLIPRQKGLELIQIAQRLIS